MGKVENDLDNLLFEWLGSEKPITILDLSGIPSEIMISISGTLLKIITTLIMILILPTNLMRLWNLMI